MTQDEEVRNGQWAESLLKDARWVDAWESERRDLVNAMLAAKTDEGTACGKKMILLLNDVRARFEARIRNGKAAAHEIKLEEERKKSKWPWAA